MNLYVYFFHFLSHFLAYICLIWFNNYINYTFTFFAITNFFKPIDILQNNSSIFLLYFTDISINFILFSLHSNSLISN